MTKRAPRTKGRINMNYEMIKYKKSLKKKQARHTVSILSVNTSPYIVDVLKSYSANFQ